MISCNPSRFTAAAYALAAVVALSLTGATATAQVLSVQPVNVFLSPGQKAATISVTNPTTAGTSVQIRAYSWGQKDNDDQLTATNLLVASPPLVTIAPGATQIVRFILRQSPEYREATYRIIIDQIPPPAEPGVVHMVLRISIPIFAAAPVRSFADVQFHIEKSDGKVFLVGSNRGNMHESIRDIVLVTHDGHKLKAVSGPSPYILEGATRRWQIDAQDYVPGSEEYFQLTAHAIAGPIDQQVRVVNAR
jgi:fimbrial chaperone protein